mgnify:CR=1 FL=1
MVLPTKSDERPVNILLDTISIVVTVIGIIFTVVGIIVTIIAIHHDTKDNENKRSNCTDQS